MNKIHSEKSTLSTIKHTNNHNIRSTNRRFIIQTRTNVIDILFENTVHNNVVTQIFKVIKTRPRKLVNVLFQVSIFLSNSNCTNNQSRHTKEEKRDRVYNLILLRSHKLLPPRFGIIIVDVSRLLIPVNDKK